MANEELEPQAPPIQPTPTTALTIRMQEREIMAYPVIESELNSIATASTDTSLYFGLFTFLFGVGLNIVIVLSTVAEGLSDRAYAAYWAVLLVCVIGCFVSGIKAAGARTRRTDELQRIRSKAGAPGS